MKLNYKIATLALTGGVLAGLLSGCEDGTTYSDPCSSAGKSWNPGACDQVASVAGTPENCPIGFNRVNNECVADAEQCPAGEHYENGSCVTDQLTVDVINRTACTVTRNGVTQMIVQFITRDESGLALNPGYDEQNQPRLVTSELFINSDPVDVESTISRNSELLKSNLMLSLVLDSSYSMLTHNPPAFEPMKEAAAAIVQGAQDTWQANQSSFNWSVVWFNEYLYEPAPNMAGEPWNIEDIALIPEPRQGRLTGLYKAVNYMHDVHQRLYNEGVAATDRDQHIMVVFSDGEDNHSYHPNDEYSATGDWNGMLYWREFGAPAINLETLEQKLKSPSLPNLRVHVIGFGAGADDQELRTIAESGNGQYFFGSSADTLGQIFSEVQQEFATLQTIGAEVPLEEGTYSVSLRARHEESGAEGSAEFEVTSGDTLPACSQ